MHLVPSAASPTSRQFSIERLPSALLSMALPTGRHSQFNPFAVAQGFFYDAKLAATREWSLPW